MKKLYILSTILGLVFISTTTSAQYCTPPQPIDGPYTGITKVTMGSIDNASPSDDGYIDFTGTTTAPAIDQGSTQTITISYVHTLTAIGFTDSLDVRIWIDWNQDFDFIDAGEDVISEHLDLSSGAEIVTFSISVPADAAAGVTRMRLYEDMLEVDGHEAPNPCGYGSGLGQHGEIEDYEVNILTTSTPEYARAAHSFEIYPNPITDKGIVHFDGNIEISEISLYNIIGEKVVTYPVSSDLDGLVISTTDLHPGIYFLRASAPEVEMSRKVVVR